MKLNDLENSGLPWFDPARCQEVSTALLDDGAVLLRNSGIVNTAELAEAMQRINDGMPLLPYEEDKVSPRTRLDQFVYTSTNYRREVGIFFHNECCTRKSWPMRLVFFCKHAVPRGRTPITDVRRVTAGLSERLKSEFRERKVLYIRNMGGPLGNSLESSFGTHDRDELERLFASEAMTAKWLDDARVQLTFRREPFIVHPLTGEELWFNNALFWHPMSLDRVLRQATRNRSVDELAFYTRFGDGGEIPQDLLKELMTAYEAASTTFDWQDGDCLFLDNMLVAHGREPYDDASREVWVSMAGDYDVVRARSRTD